jgi:hypothetical protein
MLIDWRRAHPASGERVTEGTLDMVAHGLLRGSDTPPDG